MWSLRKLYAVEPEGLGARIESACPAIFDHDSVGGVREVDDLFKLQLVKHWDFDEQVDWSRDFDPLNPGNLPYEVVGAFGSEPWEKLGAAERDRLRLHAQAWMLSQSFHGEQVTMMAASRLVSQAPETFIKTYAASQAFDDARHLEAYRRLIARIGVLYPMSRGLAEITRIALSQSEWDLTLLWVSVVMKSMGLANFQSLRDNAGPSLLRQVHAYAMVDETRHVAFARTVLGSAYAELDEAARRVREDAVIDALGRMRDDVVQADEVYAQAGMDVAACNAANDASPVVNMYRALMFQRLVPTIRAIGLFSPRIREAFDELGVLDYADVDLPTFLAAERRAAREIAAELKGT